MATYHLSVQAISRGTGRSLVAATAYRTCTRMVDERTGLTHDYRRKTGHVDGGMVGWSGTTEGWANAAEAAERHPRALVAREVVVALPRELSTAEHRRIVVAFAAWLRERHGLAVRWDIHRPRRNAEDNPHAHLLLTSRRVSADGCFEKKARELDVKTTSGTHILAWRREWERAVNEALRNAGVDLQVDSRSLQARAAAAGLPVALKPLERLGPICSALERRGQRTLRGDTNRWRRWANAERRRLLADWRAIQNEIARLQPLARLEHRQRRAAVVQAVAAFREVSLVHPRPVRERARVFVTMLETAQRTWPRGWARALHWLLRRAWPEGPRVASGVGRRLVASSLLPPAQRAATELLSTLLDDDRNTSRTR